MQSEKTLYKVDQLPIFQNRMYDSEFEAKNCPRGDVHLVENLVTGLVYNASFLPELMVYDAQYQNEQAVSPLFSAHLKSVEKIIERNMGKVSLVEVGCGKGTFLEMLLSDGFDINGFDPTYEGSNPRIACHYFEPSLGIKGNGLILRHVLEHIQDPFNFLARLSEANGGVGLIYIEVPCFDWICNHCAWFDIFYEHVNYFRQSDFHRMFARVLDSGRIFGDQYLYVVADLASLKQPTYDEKSRSGFPEDFLRGLTEHNRTEQNRTEQNRTEQQFGEGHQKALFSRCLSHDSIRLSIPSLTSIQQSRVNIFLRQACKLSRQKMHLKICLLAQRYS